MKRRTTPAARPGQEVRDDGGRPRQRPRWLVVGLAAVLSAVLAVAAVAGWEWYRRPARIAAAVPSWPELANQPEELRVRLERAYAKVRQRTTVLEGVEELGLLFHANGHFAEAEVCWRALEAEEPRNARWSYFRADLRRLESDNPAMMALLARTTALAPDYAPAWLRLADVQFKSGELAAAQRSYEERLARIPGDPHARLGLARVALQQDRRVEARALVRDLVRDAPKFPPGHNLLAEMLAAEGDAAGAAKTRLLGRNTGRFREADDPWLEELADACFDYEQLSIRGIVDLQTKHGDWGQAAFERSLRVRPDELANHEMLGNLYLEKKDAGRARDVYEDGLRRAAAMAPPATYYIGLSRAYRELRQPAEAVRVVRAGLERIGEGYELYDALGSALLDAGENEAAVAALRKAIASSPADAAVGYNLAIALIAVRRLDEAVEALHRSLAAQPTFPSTLALLAQIEIDSGRWQDALKYVQPLYESHPGLPLAREKMATYHLHAGVAAEQARDPAAAERHYRAGLDLQAHHAGLHARLGALYLGQRRFSEALAPLEAFRQLEPKDARGALLLGQAYVALGRRDEARRALGDGAAVAERAGDAALAEHIREALRRLP